MRWGGFKNWGRKNQEPEVLKKWINHPTLEISTFLSIVENTIVDHQFQIPTNFIMETNCCIIFQPTNHLLIYALQEGGNSPPYFSQIDYF